MIKEGDKVRLTTGEVAYISEILEMDVAYIAEIFRQNGDVSVTIEQISHDEIASVFEEIERPVLSA